MGLVHVSMKVTELLLAQFVLFIQLSATTDCRTETLHVYCVDSFSFNESATSHW